MSINWQSLRSLNNSQNTAFEEICCQLAAYELTPQGSTFIRKGAPDAGVECYWILPNGDEWAWQAKYFLSRPEGSQWDQLDDSVRTALDKHPRLTSYTICLPIDRQDPRIETQKWFMDQWNERTQKWRAWAQQKSMSVEFSYWGGHELLERLSREEHRGRYFFWLNKELFSEQWFKNHIEEAVTNVGPRYTPELNVQLPIARLFDSLGRTTAFHQRFRALLGKIKQTYLKTRSEHVEQYAPNQYILLNEINDQLLDLLQNIENKITTNIKFQSIAELASKLRDVAWDTSRALEDIAKTRGQDNSSAGQPVQGDSPDRVISGRRYQLEELARHAMELEELASRTECKLANTPALLLTGTAGTGKSHLFCDVAQQRITSELPTILLLGEQFGDREPWSQIIEMLGLSCSKEELLGALEAAAQARHSKALILIDALNEGEGKKIWSKYIAGMLTTLSRYPRLSIAVSVRSSYENTVIPEGLVPNRLIRVEHQGFANHEYEAAQTFFNYYGIKAPSVPLLNPEFKNPLFLKLFCKGLKNRGFTEVPTGLQGVTAIFGFFIDSVNKKLAHEERLNFDEKSELVQKVISALAEKMADKGETWLPRDSAQEIVNAFLPREGYENSLFRQLIVEGILAEDRFLLDREHREWVEGVRFSYERLSDHLVVNHLLDRHFDVENPAATFLPGQPLGSFVKDEWSCSYNRGIIEALSIQIPELTGKEFTDYVPQCSDWQPVLEAFVESIMWRNPDAITEATFNYINEHVLYYKDTHDSFLDALLTVASNTEHPLNADFIHKHLMKYDLAKRDAWWSVFLHDQYRYRDYSAVDRLINWAWASTDKSHINDESIRLSGIALAWFLTSSNRYIRDRATKALVALLTGRIRVLQQVIAQFLGVNDPYISERLYAVAYGCAMRSNDLKAVAKLAASVYEWVFKDGEPPPHIMLRDYARGVVEMALHNGSELEIDVNKIRPPYKSDWPTEIPTKGELEKYEKVAPSIYYSVMEWGDFARYIIGTNSHRFYWTSRRLEEPPHPTRKERYEAFVESLTEQQKKAWDKYQNVRRNVEIYRELDEAKRLERFTREFTNDELTSAIRFFEQRLRKTLGKRKLEIFDEFIDSYLKDPNRHIDETRFDLSIAQRWILQRVFDLGWTAELFAEFDRKVTQYEYHGRSAHKPERIGKKYQWIAYYEFLARVSDNFEFKGNQWSGRAEKFEGPWQVLNRDIDPSCLLKRTGHAHLEDPASSWWFPITYDIWGSELSATEWVKNTENLPDARLLIEVINPADGSEWLTLTAIYDWKPPILAGEDRSSQTSRTLWYVVESYVVKKTDMEEVFEWAKAKHFTGSVMPGTRDLYEILLGEYYWAPAYNYHNIPYYNHPGWDRGLNDQIPKKVLVTSEGYMRENSGKDCSLDDGYTIELPVKWIVDNMNLRWNGVEGHFFNEEGELVAFDPSVRNPGPRALLLNKAKFLEFLNKSGYDILWTMFGEKYDYYHSPGPNWEGRVEVSGAYRVLDSKVDGVLTARFSES
jgi:hypothetical protein